MAEETKIAMKIEEETKDIKKICERLTEAVKYELDKGIENVDAKELGEVIDMIKDLYEGKKAVVEACYYKQVMEAMEEYGDEEMDEDRRFYRGQPRSRTSGRYMSRGDGRRGNSGRRGYEEMMPDYEEMEQMRDMDRYAMGRMYYSEGGSQGGSSTSGRGSSQGGSSSGGGSRGYSEGGNQGGSQGGNQGGGRGGQSSSRSENARRNYTEMKQMNKGGSAEEKKENMANLEEYLKELSSEMTDLVGDMDASEKQMVRTKLQTLAQKVQ